MKNKFSKRLLSAILCVAMLITTLPAIPLSVSAASAAGTEPVVITDVEFHDGIDYEITRTTRYIGNRTYSVQIDVSADLSTFEHARIRTASRNGYVTIQETGYYLIELWGGDGGDGQMGWTVALIPVPTDGGNGAHGGYVYGKVFLKAGQTLVYNIGTNGDESTVYNDEGGGVNGDGGTHGDQGSYKVGGGGGYTAIYLFEEGEFNESYVTDTAVNIPETARLSRYLMIAGGGGGGGAGFTNLISNGSAGSPNGGMGGNINNGISMSLLGDDYLVPGYVFSGRNGQSSGTSTEYVGRGGSNVPGAVSETLMGYFTQNQLPNDWTGTHNSSVSPGAGGSGNFRGGGGGSGYAGGSGGIMTAQLIASNVGGGGGGSSFVADEVNGQKIVFQTLTDEERAYLSGSTAQPVGANTGGAVQITYLSGAEDEFYQEALDNITIGATISRYFDVLSSSKTTGSNALSITVNGDETTYVKASGLSIIPASPAHGGKTAYVTLFIRAKDEFMGGNGVQLIDGVSADFLSPNDNVTPIHIVPSDVKAHKFVNVPLNATIKAKSYTSSQKGKAYAVSSLYEDDYVNGSVSIRDNLTSYWEYDHISAISTYRVYQNGTQITASSVAPTETTTYEVRYDITPLIAPDSEVTVGPAIESPTTITGKAVISVVAPGTAVLNGLDVTGSKTLSYANGKYDFSVLINQESPTVLLENTNTTTTTSGSWTAPVDGWYYIQVWGGNGGSSGTVSCSGVNGNDVRTASAGSGGTGGYVTGYIYLSQGEVLSLTVGSAGSTGSNNTGNRLSQANSLFSSTSRHEVHQSWPGGGGGYSLVEMSGSPLLIAGGGGGAGSSVVTIAQYAVVYSQTASRSGGSVSSSASSTLAASLSSYNGSAGQRNGSGNAGVSLGIPTNMTATAGSAGTAGSNYRLSGMSSGYDSTNSGNELPEEAKKYAQQQSSSKNGRSGGQVAITLVATEDSQAAYDKLMDVETEIAISRYFDIESIDLATGDTYSTTSFNDNGDGSYTKIYKNASGNQVAKFSYRTVTAADGVSSYIKIFDVEYLPDPITETQGTTYYLHYESTLDFTFKLTPKDGFLGGNDVPVLAYGQIDGVADKDSIADYGVRVLQGDEFMNLPAADPTDFANVENTVDMADYLTVQDKTIHLGDSVQKTELYTFTPPTYGADAWEDDYATFISPGNETYTPAQTTDYTITASFVPRITTAQKATIVESLPAQEYSLTATVYVEVPVTTELTNLTCDNVDWTLWGESFGCTLTPKSGYILPEEITVTINGEETSNYTYNNSVGTVSIEGQYVTGPIVITAKAAVKTYNIYILYTNYDAELGMDVQQPQVEITGIQADETIDWSQLETIKGTINAKTGYNYSWVFETDDGKQPTKMPANNLWVYGSYEKASYPLTINYVKKVGETSESISTYKADVVYGDNYSVVSPAVKGYLPDQTVVSRTMGAEAVTITVTYTPSKNKLIILYQKESDGTLLQQYEQDTVTGETYTVNSPEIVGYETDTPVVTVTMEGEDTQTVIVKYTPKKYTITFDKNGQSNATLDMPETKLVEYDNIYSFNAMPDEDGKYVHDGLPTAQVAGYTFAGWFTEPECTNEVKESDTVKITADTTLYAKWERTKFKLTVRYDFLYENGDYVPEGFDSVDAVRASLTDDVIEIAYGDPYSVALPALTGYSAYENFGLNDQEKLEILSGTMPGQNMLVVISYEINTYEIKFMDLSGSHVNYSDKDTSTVASDSFDTVWKTVNVKHNVVPVYEEADPTPNHATREEYTYSFTGWYGSNDGAIYSGKTPTFPAATSERNYYAIYDATENIVAVTYGSKVEYFTDVASALEFAETNISSGVIMDFRRNAGNERVLNLNDDTLVFGNTYTGTTNYTVTIDLNGIALQNTRGQSVVENTLRPLTIVISDSGAGGNISVTGDDDVIAIQSTTGSLTVNNQISVDVTSNNGDATGIKFGNATNSYTLSYANELSSINVTAANGTACGIDVVGTSTVKPAAVNVTGKDAVGIRTNDGTALTLSGTTMALNVSGTENATGICIAEGTSLVNTVSNTKEQTVTSQGNAYGIYNEGTLSSLNLKVTVTGTNNAYGLYNKAGTVTVTGIGSGLDLRATGTNGYGLYNQADGTAIGAEDSNKLNKGAFAGSSYGIYSADNSIFASGNYLYFKGADKEAALEGVVYDDTLYDEVDAKEQFEDGYYRLAALQTITFETNGGTAISSITLYFDELLPSDLTTKKNGYTFDNWYEDEALELISAIPERMPAEDLTLYAKWSLNTYYYSLDKEFKELTVNFYKNTSSTDSTIVSTVKLTEESPYLTVPADQTYISSSYVYVQSGWYTGRTPANTATSANYVVFDGDISRYDTDNDGIVNFYAGWERSSDQMYSTSSYKKLGTDSSNPASAYITGYYDTSGDSYYMYYQVPVDGDYTFHFTNSSSSTSSYARKYGYIYKHIPNSSTSASTSTSITISTNSTYSKTMSGLIAGDVILIKLYRGYSSTSSSYNSTVTCYVSSTADLSAVNDRQASSGYYEEPIEYNVEMGTVTLPIADNTGHEDKKFVGWAENAESTRFMQITPDMVDTVEQWQNDELWKLYSQWDERTWAAYQIGKRDFTAFDSTAQVNILSNDTVSVRFMSENTPTEALTFKFANGLPAGTILTLIDRSGSVPVYYTYTTTEVTKELSSTAFVKMGAATDSFSGISKDVVLQICYKNTTATSTAETVSIYAGDIVSEVDAVYGITPMGTITGSNGSVSFPYSEKHTLNVTVPALSGLGLNEDDKVLLRVRWDGVNLAPGSVISLNGVDATIYDGEYALLDTGFTVADMKAETSATMSIYLPTMVQNEFEGKTFYYELCIAPNSEAAFGMQVQPLIVVTEELTLQETPSLTVDEVDKTVKVGESVSVTVNNADAEFYLVQQNGDGTFECNANCITVFETLTADENGKLSAAEGTLVTDNTFTATVSANAVRGKYYLVVKLGDKYERILLRLTANTTE